MNLIKSLAYKILPDFSINSLKKKRHSRQFKDFRGDNLSEFPIFEKIITQGSSVIDLGANIGLYSKCFSSLVGETGKVYSIEPIPFTFSVLSNNIIKSNLQNVLPFQFAASNKVGDSEMTIPSYRETHGIDSKGNQYAGEGLNYYTASLESFSSAESHRVSVPLLTLDDFVRNNNIADISFIKCDVEGHELAVFQGASQSLRKFSPSLYIEIMDDLSEPTTNGAALFDYLIDFGYRPYVYVPETKKLKEWKRGDLPQTNYFFFPLNQLLICSCLP